MSTVRAVRFGPQRLQAKTRSKQLRQAQPFLDDPKSPSGPTEEEEGDEEEGFHVYASSAT